MLKDAGNCLARVKTCEPTLAVGAAGAANVGKDVASLDGGIIPGPPPFMMVNANKATATVRDAAMANEA